MVSVWVEEPASSSKVGYRNEGFALFNEIDGPGKRRSQQFLQPSVRRVAATQPDHLRRWAKALDEQREVRVFGQDDGAGLTSCIEDFGIACVTQSEIANSDRVDCKL